MELRIENKKLKNFPPINFISVIDSEKRRNFLYKKFEDNGLTEIVPHIFERYRDGDHIIKTIEGWEPSSNYFGAVTSHLKAIKKWYDTTDEEYAFFCEDDISFETVKYWNFTWEEFFNSLPSDWNCVQLALTRENFYATKGFSNMFLFFRPEVHLRNRCWDDWSCVAYIMTRKHAKKLIDNYYDGKTFTLIYNGIDKETRDVIFTKPTTETLVYSFFESPSNVLLFPLFVEDIGFQSDIWENDDIHKTTHYFYYSSIITWWKNRGKYYGIEELNKIREDTQSGLNYFGDDGANWSPWVPIEDKLKNFPPINFISMAESEDRRNLLYKKLEENGLSNITPHIFEKYNDEEHKFVGNNYTKLSAINRGPTISHLKAIKDWYFDTDEEYAFFCQDDISFETVKYWNFTWEEFFNSLPQDWGAIQLSWVRENMYIFSHNGLRFRNRCWCDWSSCAYLIRRPHAKKLISHYYRNGEFNLDFVGDDLSVRRDWALVPTPETIIFSSFSRIYGCPLFVEDVNNFNSMLSNNEESFLGRWYNHNSYHKVIEWWETDGKNMSVSDLFNGLG